MYYEGHKNHGLAHDPFKAIITPRPIGWISTVDTNGVPNLAPYSFFNAISGDPPMLIFSSESLKDSALNARETGEFVFSLCSVSLTDQMNASSAVLPPEENEYNTAGLASAPCKLVAPPRVADSPASMECKTLSVTEMTDVDGKPVDCFLVIGQVIATHINDDFIRDGRFDTAAAQPLARCGYRDYAAVREVFELLRPSDSGQYTGVDR